MIAVFTIVSRNYLHFAKTLMGSLHEHSPGLDRFVVLCDEMDDALCADPNYELIDLASLPLDHESHPGLRYNILEFNTSVKPAAFRFLFESLGYGKVIYLDPDIRVYSDFEDLLDRLDHSDILLTPHLTGPLEDAHHPGEIDILRAGSFNLGFTALRASPNSLSFLSWWASRLEENCVSEPDRGLFVDQKWMDLVPGMFDGVEIVRDPGWNLAYWNLPSRTVGGTSGKVTVNGSPLVFFHFSGIEARGSVFSKHQNRYSMSTLPCLIRELAIEYQASLIENGADRYAETPYAFETFRNGAPIPEPARRIARQLHAEGQLRSLVHNEDTEFQAHLNAPSQIRGEAIQPITVLAHQLWKERPDLQAAFPDLLGAHRYPFAHWFKDNASEQTGIHSSFIEPICAYFESLDESPRSGIVREQSRVRGSVVYRTLYKLARRLRGPARMFVKPETRARIQQLLLVRANGVRRQTLDSPPHGVRADRVRVIGYLCAESGVGESARAFVRSSLAAGLDTAIVDYRVGCVAGMSARIPEGVSSFSGSSINILHINADQIPRARAELERIFQPENYNIGYWHWETPELPAEFADAFEHLDEIWTSSSFCQAAIAKHSPLPVTMIPHSISLPEPGKMTRAEFGLDESSFVLLTMWDAVSITRRKNPEATIAAFLRARELGLENAQLVIKMSNVDYDRATWEYLLQLQQKHPEIVLLRSFLERSELVSLYEASDAFISLHRSEGFGLCLAEAMSLGKLVIATGWSGNMDFMTETNSFPVDCEIRPIDESIGPYPAGSFWAEPNIERAAKAILEASRDDDTCRAMRSAARLGIAKALDPEVVGQKIQRRLAAIANAREAAQDV